MDVGYENFYSLNDPLADAPLRFKSFSEKDRFSRDEHFAMLYGGELPKKPYKMIAYMGKVQHEIMYPGSVGEIFVSDRIKREMEKFNLSGWGSFPVRLFNYDKTEIKGFHGLSILGSHVDVDFTRCIVKEEFATEYSKMSRTYYGYFFNRDQWDGSDFFRSNKHLLITKRVRDAFREIGVTNLEIISVLEETRSGILIDFDREWKNKKGKK